MKYLYIIIIFVLFQSVIAQNSENEFQVIQSKHSKDIQTSAFKGVYHMGKDQAPDPMLNLNRISVSKPGLENEKEWNKYQDTVNQSKQAYYNRPINSRAAVEVELDTSFIGNNWGGGTPPDNDIAVSKAGFVVSVVNSNIRIFDTVGNVLSTKSLGNFGRDVLGFTNVNEFDPRVVYDPVEDKFIVVFLAGSDPSFSRVVIGFSRTSNPTEEWNLYELDGNIGNYDSWFDYPCVGINNNELFISGNLFSAESQSLGTALFQINKEKGFKAEDLAYNTWSGIQNADGGYAFTVYPLSYGGDGEYGPEMHFVTTYGSYTNSNTMPVYTITNSIDNDPEMLVKHFESDRYKPSGSADQLDTEEKLSIGDSRMQDGLILDSVIHCVFMSRHEIGYSGINYMRIPLNSDSAYSTMIGAIGIDNAYPSIAFAGCDSAHHQMAISYLTSSANQYPSAELVILTDLQEVSDPIVLKEGEGYVDLIANENDRWGDYSGTARQFGNNKPKIWSGICYGSAAESRHLDTYIASSNVQLDCALKLSMPNTAAPITSFIAYPNPMINLLSIQFQLKTSTFVDVELFDIQGKRVALLLHDRAKAGTNAFSFNKLAFASGQYILKVSSVDLGLLNSSKIIVE